MGARGTLAAGLFVLTTSVGAVAATAGAAAATPSFDCDGAKSDVEKLICSDDELADLDVRLAKAFASALALAPANDVAVMRANQKSWRRELLGCGKSGDLRACTVNAYHRRLDEL